MVPSASDGVKYSRASEVLDRAVPGYLALAKIDGTIAEVHGPGADVWSELTSPTGLEEIVDNLVSRYIGDRATVLEDVRDLLQSLEAGGYVTQDG